MRLLPCAIQRFYNKPRSDVYDHYHDICAKNTKLSACWLVFNYVLSATCILEDGVKRFCRAICTFNFDVVRMYMKQNLTVQHLTNVMLTRNVYFLKQLRLAQQFTHFRLVFAIPKKDFCAFQRRLCS